MVAAMSTTQRNARDPRNTTGNGEGADNMNYLPSVGRWAKPELLSAERLANWRAIRDGNLWVGGYAESCPRELCNHIDALESIHAELVAALEAIAGPLADIEVIVDSLARQQVAKPTTLLNMARGSFSQVRSIARAALQQVKP